MSIVLTNKRTKIGTAFDVNTAQWRISTLKV